MRPPSVPEPHVDYVIGRQMVQADARPVSGFQQIRQQFLEAVQAILQSLGGRQVQVVQLDGLQVDREVTGPNEHAHAFLSITRNLLVINIIRVPLHMLRGKPMQRQACQLAPRQPITKGFPYNNMIDDALTTPFQQQKSYKQYDATT